MEKRPPPRDEDFDEKAYLLKYPDVARAVEKKSIVSGKWHYFTWGKKEGRDWRIDPITDQSPIWKSYKEWAIYHKELENFSEFEMLMTKIKNKESFHLARYNDGEWLVMLQIGSDYQNTLKRNNHNHEQVQEIAQKLLKIMDGNPDYYIGVDSTTRAGYGLVASIRDKFKKRLEAIKHLLYGDLFNAATVRFGINCLLDPLRTRYVISVGPVFMRELQIAQQHITVPYTDCWTATEFIKNQVDAAINRGLAHNPVVIYSCSFLAKLLVDINYHKFGNKITQMDIGSCIDPWCGVISRPWHPMLAGYYRLQAKTDPSHFRE